MVVDDIENHAQAMLMRRIDEAAKIVGRAVEPRRREQIDAVVAPAEAALKLRDRHDFQHRHARLGEPRQLLRWRRPKFLRA